MLNKAFYSILLKNTFQIVIVCIGISPPLKKTLPPQREISFHLYKAFF